MLALASLASAQVVYNEDVDPYGGLATGYATGDTVYDGTPSTGEYGGTPGGDYTPTGGEYVEDGGVVDTSPPIELPYTVPDVVYTAGYGTDYFAQDPLGLLWQTFWKRYHIMKYQVDVIEAYRDEITMQVNKLSQKVFAWCRSKSQMSLNCMCHMMRSHLKTHRRQLISQTREIKIKS